MKQSDDKRNTIDDTPLNGPVFCVTQLSEGWYRLVTAVGTRTLTTCVDSHKCGEVNPGWLTLDSQRQLLRENLLTFPVCVIRYIFIRKLSHLTISSPFISINQKMHKNHSSF